jgi:biotin carboxylase
VHLVIGFKPIVENALRQAGVPHLTVTEMHKLAKADLERSSAQLLPCGDCTDVEAVLSALRRACVRLEDIDLVWGTDEFTIVTSSAIGRALGRPTHLSLDAALRFRDKYLQKHAVAATGQPTARVAVLTRLSDVPGAAAQIGFPAVLKPISGAGTSFTCRVDSPAELAERLGTFLAGHPYQQKFLRSGPALLESFVVGDELHVDGCVFDGVIPTIGVSRYIGNNLEVLQTGGPCGAYITDPVRQAGDYAVIRELATDWLRALGLVNGVFHIEVFETEDGFQFSECAARIGGNGVLESFREKFGLDLLEEHVKSLCGRPPGQPVRSESAYCRTFMGAPAGIVASAPDLRALLGRPGVLEATIDVVVGEPTPDMRRDTSTRAASAIVEGPDEATLLARVDELREWFYGEVSVHAA